MNFRLQSEGVTFPSILTPFSLTLEKLFSLLFLFRTVGICLRPRQARGGEKAIGPCHLYKRYDAGGLIAFQKVTLLPRARHSTPCGCLLKEVPGQPKKICFLWTARVAKFLPTVYFFRDFFPFHLPPPPPKKRTQKKLTIFSYPMPPTPSPKRGKIESRPPDWPQFRTGNRFFRLA